METFVFVISVMIMIVAFEYNMFWLMIIIAGVLVYVGKDIQTFIITSGIIFTLYIIKGTALQSYYMYIVAAGIVIYMIINRNADEGGSGASFNPNDQYADLLKGLGG